MEVGEWRVVVEPHWAVQCLMFAVPWSLCGIRMPLLCRYMYWKLDGFEVEPQRINLKFPY